MTTIFTEESLWGITVAQTAPSYAEYTMQIATLSGNMQQMALEYFQGLYPSSTFKVLLVENLGIPLVTD